VKKPKAKLNDSWDQEEGDGEDDDGGDGEDGWSGSGIKDSERAGLAAGGGGLIKVLEAFVS